MLPLKSTNIPACLKELPQWVTWKISSRAAGDKPTKLPFQVNDVLAKANDPSTWATFDAALDRFNLGGYAGIGFEFSETDPFCGVDLDGCRNQETGTVEEWAKEIILKFSSYAELSPTGTGVKIFCRGIWGPGRKVPVPGAAKVCEKEPGIEVYDWGRYFAVTGQKLTGLGEVRECKEQIQWMREKYFPERHAAPISIPLDSDSVVDRARKYVAKLPGAISGSSGHNVTFHAACVLVLGFELSEGDALAVLSEYNQRCQPQWSERELIHKVRQAGKQSGDRGYLKNAQVATWHRVKIPTYYEPASTPEPRTTTLADAVESYLDSFEKGEDSLLETGIGELDYAIAGGIAKGEMVIIAARPSHGKSAVGLQLIHEWTSKGMTCVMVSEEMSAMALGKRALQFTSSIPEEHWRDRPEELRKHAEEYRGQHAPCYIVEGCGTAIAAAQSIMKHVNEHNAQCAIIDYAQLLRSEGKSRYEQVTNTSILLRQLANETKIVLVVLCQLSRGIESRNQFLPVMSDLKETGQLEQDADVIVFLCWPWMLNKDEPQNKYQFFISKNRNRARNSEAVTCRFVPERQKILDPKPEPVREREWSDYRR